MDGGMDGLWESRGAARPSERRVRGRREETARVESTEAPGRRPHCLLGSGGHFLAPLLGPACPRVVGSSPGVCTCVPRPLLRGRGHGVGPCRTETVSK